MELGFDHSDLLGGLQSPPAESARANLLDWAGLKARFLAAHALRIELERLNAEEPPGGSFLLAGERVLSLTCSASRGVNPSALGKGKESSAIESDIPGFASPAIEE